MNMGLRDIGATLPPGFRFYPSDEELVCHYLSKKINNEAVLKGTLVEIDLHTCEPWQLPEVAKLNATEWYFFSFRDRKYATGFRTNRATISGYWKATGKDRMVLDPINGGLVGMRKTLVFYRNRAPKGDKTGWIMHEFRMETPRMPPKEDWVLCRVFHKSKGEDSNKLSPEFITTTNASSLNSAVSPTYDWAMPFGYQPNTPLYQNHYQNSSMLNILQYPQEENTSHVYEFTSQGEHNYDEHGPLLDMELLGNCLGYHGEPSNLGYEI